MSRSHHRSETVVETGAGTATGVTRPSRAVRRRALRIAAAGLTAVAALSLTACGQDNPLQTGAAKPYNPAPQAPQDQAAKGDGSLQVGVRHERGRTEQASAEVGGPGAQTGTSGTRAGTGKVGKGGSASGVRHTACDAAKIRIVAQQLKRPVNHLLLEATNTSGATCDLHLAPYLRFDEAQSPLPELSASKPQAVVTLAPGESGYAAVQTSSADGSGGNGRTMRSLSVSLPGRDGKGSIGGSATVALPGGSVYVDDSAWVTYWQSDASAATTW
ncbi:DUF4232 domain-containing protein [Streptomyces tubercidicus]|uniref:DUF4232 domain-containing protein n=1 Tax=Streptomyces tubercidicus TaxID=47759 RepID=A0A640UTE5_9ACTN|nr:DUF4232 domain-containing protein [Streptomyces tubercidicus]WAU13150.1 DUF4232 domain-containing protein [Streptomyces tubercidicus]GFE38710.1 hypothetical protein Stube_33830 [Streptomyces tubercidicus]